MRFLLVPCGVVACGGNLPAEIQYDEVAQIVGATLATPERGGTLGAVDDSLSLAFGRTPGGFTFDTGMTSGFHGGLEHRYIMVMCGDAESRPMPECTPDSHMAVLVATWSGTIALAGFDVRTERHGMWTLENLQSAMPAINGESETTSTAVPTDNSTSYHVRASAIETMVAPQDMKGGNIQLELDVARGVFTAAISGEIVFDAIAWSAILVLDGNSYRIDLGTGEIDKSL
jgi:hypothetical protein